MTLGKDPHLAQRITRALRDTYAGRQDPNADRLAGRQEARSGRRSADTLTNHLAIFSPVATLGKLFRR